MRAKGSSDTRLLPQFLADLLNAGKMHGCPGLLPRKEPLLRLAPAPVDAEQLQQFGRELDLAGKLSFAFSDVDQHALAVDVSD
jgi:hypothetical protein